MTGAMPIAAISSNSSIALGQLAAPNLAFAPTQSAGFLQLLSDGAQKVSDDALNADRLVRAFAIDDSIPVHQVTYALEQAQLSLNLMMQVRNRLVDAYQQMMNMQL